MEIRGDRARLLGRGAVRQRLFRPCREPQPLPGRRSRTDLGREMVAIPGGRHSSDDVVARMGERSRCRRRFGDVGVVDSPRRPAPTDSVGRGHRADVRIEQRRNLDKSRLTTLDSCSRRAFCFVTSSANSAHAVFRKNAWSHAGNPAPTAIIDPGQPLGRRPSLHLGHLAQCGRSKLHRTSISASGFISYWQASDTVLTAPENP